MKGEVGLLSGHSTSLPSVFLDYYRRSCAYNLCFPSSVRKRAVRQRRAHNDAALAVKMPRIGGPYRISVTDAALSRILSPIRRSLARAGELDEIQKSRRLLRRNYQLVEVLSFFLYTFFVYLGNSKKVSMPYDRCVRSC